MAHPVSAASKALLWTGAALVLLGLGAGASAQGRDPAYAAARATGQVGEMMNGYLGIVGAGAAGLRHTVEDINIRRKAVYVEKAQAQHATLEEYAFTSGCVLILHTEPGEKYQAPDGSWQTRGAGAPMRDARCP